MSRGQRFEQLEKNVKQMQMATQIGQIMQQQLNQTLGAIKDDITSLAPQFQNIQYSLLALQQLLDIDTKKMNEIAGELRLKDWTEANDKEDAEGNFKIKLNVDTDQDFVIISSSTPDEEENKGMFRSRQLIAQLPPELAKEMIGKGVGDKVDFKSEEVRHVIEILGVREAPPAPEPQNDVAPEEKPAACNQECDKECTCDEKDK